MRDFEVSVKRGLYLRNLPVITPSTIIGELKYGQHFTVESGNFRRIDGLWWGRNPAGQWMVLVNGHNSYVTENGKPVKPLG